MNIWTRSPRESGVDSSFEASRNNTYPPPYPSGWYKVADADEIRDGRVIRVSCLGEHLALFRDGDGRARAFDARCPHLGADLSDGTVKNGCLECPFHRWQFHGDGAVAHIPYQSRIPASLRARTWPVRELCGMIFVYHAHHAADRAKPPLYELPDFDDITSGRFVFRGRRDYGIARMHLLEYPENGPDFAHFAPLHSAMTVPWTQWRIPFVDIDHQITWTADPHQAHVAHLDNHAMLKVAGKLVPQTSADTRVTFIGPGAVGVMRFTIPKVGEILLLQFHTPIAPLQLRVELRWFAEPRVPRLLVLYVVGSWVSQLAADLRIWERKSYLSKPMLIESDGPFLKFRQWYRQFYDSQPAAAQPTVGIAT